MTGLLSFVLEHLLYWALHMESRTTFPKPLSPEQERACFEKLAGGDVGAKKKLVEHNLRLVAHIAKKYYSFGCEQEDLISIGSIGLIKAIQTFSYQKGTRFATYASRCIENEMLMHFRNIRKTTSDISIHDPMEHDKDGGAFTMMELMCDEDQMVEQIDLKLKTDALYRLVEQLSPRERKVISLRYGLYRQTPLTQREIAKQMGISRSYVSRIEKKTLLLLRQGLEGGTGKGEK